MVEETLLVQNDKAGHGEDGKKLTTCRWMSSSGRMNESLVALRRKLEWMTIC